MTDTVNDSASCKIPYRPLFGVNEGWSKLSLAYRAGAQVMWSRHDHVSDEAVERISSLARKVDAFGERSATLSGSFAQSARKHSEKAVSFLTEHSIIFGAAAVGAPLGANAVIAGSAAATYPQTLGTWFLKELDKAGYDVKDPDQLKSALNDREFMKGVRRSSHVHAAQMSGAVVGAGMLAGYVYSALAKPVAGVGAGVARSVFPRLMGEFAEKSATMFGETLAKGIKSVVNSVGRKILSSTRVKPFVRGAFLTAAMVGTVSAAQAQRQDIAPERRGEQVSPGFPSYNTSLRYL